MNVALINEHLHYMYYNSSQCMCVLGVHNVDVVYDGLMVRSGPVCFTALSAASNRSKVTASRPGQTHVGQCVCVCVEGV